MVFFDGKRLVATFIKELDTFAVGVAGIRTGCFREKDKYPHYEVVIPRIQESLNRDMGVRKVTPDEMIQLFKDKLVMLQEDHR